MKTVKEIVINHVSTGVEYNCESCYFEEVCAQTEHVPREIDTCRLGYWQLQSESDNDGFAYKIWDVKESEYITNGNFGRASYDCFPEKSVARIAGRLLGKGNYEIHKFKLKRVE